jgi:hypothetical protein
MSHVGVSGSPSVTGSSGPARPKASPASSVTRPGSAVLRGLSDRELLSRVKDLVSRERAVTLEILAHLIEVERRRLHLGLGYASMFDYCTRHLGYSSSAASRRIQSARCIRDYPEIHGLLEKNEVNLSSVSLVAPILTRENKDHLLRRIRNRSQREVEAIVADYRPPVSLRDRARPVCVAVASSSASDARGLPLSETASAPSPGEHPEASGPVGSERTSGTAATQRTSGCDYSRCGSEKTPNSAGGPPRLERKFQVQFLASERFMKKFERAKALISNQNGKPSYEDVLEAALDEFLKDHDREERNKRRDERKEKIDATTNSGDPAAEKIAGTRTKGGIGRARCGQVDDPSVRVDWAGSGQVDGPLFRRWIGGLPASRAPLTDEGASRRIPAAMRDAVFARDNGRCAFIGSTGKPCDATHNLEIDHIVPYARGGTNAPDNLRLLCERHNKLEAEKAFGRNMMKRFRARE